MTMKAAVPQPPKTANRRTRSTADMIERRRHAAERAGLVLAAGGLLRLPEVLALVPVSASTWYAGCKGGRYPAPVRLSARCVAWPAAHIRDLLARIATEAQP